MISNGAPGSELTRSATTAGSPPHSKVPLWKTAAAFAACSAEVGARVALGELKHEAVSVC
jgi:hypothetical protein